MPSIRRLAVISSLILAGCAPEEVDDGRDDPDETATDTAPSGGTDTAPTGDTGVAQDPATLDGVRKECAAPSSPGQDRYIERVAPALPSEVDYVSGAGVALADVTGDGLADVIGVSQSAVTLYVSSDEGFEAVTLFTRAMTGREGLHGVVAADYDGDLDLDLFITSYPGTNLLLRNDGTTFTDVTATAGLAGPPEHHSNAAAFGDFDLDGDLDLVIAGHGFVDEEGTRPVIDFEPADPTLLYVNDGDGTFTDATELVDPLIHPDYTFTAGFHDLDDDGLLDLYIANDFAGQLGRSRALVQRDGRFVADPGFDDLTSRTTGMGLGVGDLNEDGRLDLLLPGWNELGLLMSFPGGWVDAARAVGIDPDRDRDQKVAWGSEFADLDNDGDLDVLATFGFLASRFSSNEPDQPDAAFAQTHPNVFEDRGVRWGLSHQGNTRGIAVGDANNDGWIDVVKGFTDQGTRILLARCGEARWLEVQLRQDGLNRHAIGARITVEDEGRTWMRTIFAGGSGYASSNPPVAHFGLDARETVDRITVRWPDGRLDTFTDVATRQILTITRPSEP